MHTDLLENLSTLSADQLADLADQLRSDLIRVVSKSGGHLGPNLGVIELTIALHRVFSSPRDAIVFDTGHQCYVHKMLTGRYDLRDLRTSGGIAGYPQRSESEHDLVENSHASVSLSWAHGLALGHQLNGEGDRYAVAVIGDGALTGGVAWEALNNISASGLGNVVVVLNDNGRSYEPTMGGLLSSIAGYPESAAWEEFIKAAGFAYIGPVDGHDMQRLQDAFIRAKNGSSPAFVHVLTVKGKGYEPALAHEEDKFHAVGVINPDTGIAAASPGRSWTDAFGDEIVQLASLDESIVAVTGAMKYPVGLGRMAEAFPERVIDVGIAEQHALTMAAGLASTGLHPVVAIYATFVNRAIDQLLMDVALHRCGVTLILDRAGVTGPDGPSHHGIWDISLLQAVPRIRIATPRDEETLKEVLAEALLIDDAPTVIRFPKGEVPKSLPALERWADGVDLLASSSRQDLLLIGLGPFAETCLAVARELKPLGIHATVIDPRWAIPFSDTLLNSASGFSNVITVEDGIVSGGFGHRLARELADRAAPCKVLNLGLPAAFIPHGSRAEILASEGLTASAIVDRVLTEMQVQPPNNS